MDKYYNIAGLNVKMRTFGRTEQQAASYQIDEPSSVDIVISTDGLDLAKIYPNINDDLREYMATGSLFYRELLYFDGLRLHSSAVVVDDRAFLFTADSGTGKSTHTSLWLKQFGERAFILNDDKPALRLENGTWYAYGTPWSGKYDISCNVRVPLAGVAILERGNENTIEPCSGKEVVHRIMKQVNKPHPLQYRVQLLRIVDMLISQVPIWKMQCNMDPEAAIVSYEAMSGQKFERRNENED